MDARNSGFPSRCSPATSCGSIIPKLAKVRLARMIAFGPEKTTAQLGSVVRLRTKAVSTGDEEEKKITLNWYYLVGKGPLVFFIEEDGRVGFRPAIHIDAVLRKK